MATPPQRPIGVAAAMPAFTPGLPVLVVEALQRGEKIQAIRLMREITGVGLMEAKNAVEASPHLASAVSGLSPGEVSRVAGRLGWAAAVLAFVGWLLWSAASRS